MKTDTERLDWLEKQGNGIALIHNDVRHWAIGIDGGQNLGWDEEPFDLQTSYEIEKARFRSTIREAIDWAMEHEAEL